MPVPEERVMVTVAPPVERLLLLASLAVTVRVWVLTPSAVMLALVGVRVDWVASAAPATVFDGFTRPSLEVTVASRAEGLVGEVLVGSRCVSDLLRIAGGLRGGG